MQLSLCAFQAASLTARGRVSACRLQITTTFEALAGQHGGRLKKAQAVKLLQQGASNGNGSGSSTEAAEQLWAEMGLADNAFITEVRDSQHVLAVADVICSRISGVVLELCCVVVLMLLPSLPTSSLAVGICLPFKTVRGAHVAQQGLIHLCDRSASFEHPGMRVQAAWTSLMVQYMRRNAERHANMIVAAPTTPAQLFHVLRRQVGLGFRVNRKPGKAKLAHSCVCM